jgi:S1-C subfamily serine protease
MMAEYVRYPNTQLQSIRHNHIRDSMKNICGTPWCLFLAISLSLAACSPSEREKAAAVEQESAISKIDLVRAPLPAELAPLQQKADAGDTLASLTLAQWYLDDAYESFDPDRAYALASSLATSMPYESFTVMATALDKGATSKFDETSQSLRKKAELAPKSPRLIDDRLLENTAQLLSQWALAINMAELASSWKKKSPGIEKRLGEMHPQKSKTEVRESVEKVVTMLRVAAANGNVEATGHLAFWLAVRLPSRHFPEKEILTLNVTPKLSASDVATLAQEAGDLGDARGLVAQVALTPGNDAKLAELRSKLAKVSSADSVGFVADFIRGAGYDAGLVAKIFPEIQNGNVLELKRSWLAKSARAGNFSDYIALAETYLTSDTWCLLQLGAAIDIQKWEKCEKTFKQDGAGAQAPLADGIRVGHRDALLLAGVLYLDGAGVARDYESGLDYIKRSARQGNSVAFGLLSSLSAEGGKGIPKSQENAYLYANLSSAVEGKYSSAVYDARFAKVVANVQQRLPILERNIPPDRITEAQQMTKSWVHGTPIPAMAEIDASGAARGTGFFVDDKGGMVTAAHVVGTCKRVKLVDIDKTGDVTAKDAANDIALVRFPETPTAYARIRSDPPKVGEAVFVYGFPLGGAIAANGSITAGVVSALTGLENDTNRVQVSAPVQQGNSGGPLFDSHGAVVGMVDSKLNVLRVGKVTGDLPQNVNFAIKNSSLASFLDVQSAKYSRPSWLSSLFSKDGEAVAEIGKAVTYKVACAGK